MCLAEGKLKTVGADIIRPKFVEDEKRADNIRPYKYSLKIHIHPVLLEEAERTAEPKPGDYVL